MNEPLSSIIAIAALAYIDPLSRIADERIQIITSKLESLLIKIPCK